jgi:hypothetical protein
VTGDSDGLVRAVDRLVNHVGHWTPARWAAPSGRSARAGGGHPTRAEVVHALAQRLADLEAAATGRLPRRVPRLANDLALPDQVRVMTLDLVAAAPGPDVLADAVDAVNGARHHL